MDFTTYIKNQINENHTTTNIYRVDEGMLDGFKNFFKKDSGEKSEKSENMSLFSFAFGRIASIFVGKETKTEEAIRKTLEEKLAADKKNAEDIEKARDEAQAEKIKARAEGEKNKMRLKAQKKIDAYNALKKEYEITTNFFKNNTLDMSDKEREAIYNQMDKSFRELNDPSELEAADKIKRLTDYFLIDENGNLRNANQVAEFMEKNPENAKILTDLIKETDGEIAGTVADNAKLLVARYNESAKETAKVMDDKEMEEKQKNIDKAQEMYDKNTKLAEEHETKKKAYEEKSEALRKIEEEKPKFTVDDNGVAFNKDFFNGFESLKSDDNAGPNEDKIREAAKKYGKMAGLSEEQITELTGKMIEKSNGAGGAFDDSAFQKEFKQQINDNYKDAAKKYTNDYDVKHKAAQEEVTNTKKDLDDFEEDHSEVDSEFIKNWTDPNKTKLKGEIDEQQKQLDAQKIESDKQRKSRQEARKVGEEVLNDQKVPQDIKDKIEEEKKKYEGLEPGETINDKGEVGYWHTNKDGEREFVKKPNAKNQDNTEREEYKKNLEKTLLNEPLITNNEEIIYRDGEYVKVTIKDDGTKEESSATEQEYISYKAGREHELRTETAQKKVKRAELEDIKKKYWDEKAGKLKADAIKNLSEKEKNELLEKIRNFNNILGDDKSGERLTGDWSKFEKKFKYFADSDEADNREEEDGDINNDDWEDDEDHEEIEGEDFDEEGEETATDENGNTLKKGKDGKWYKEGDLDEDGNPNEGVTDVQPAKVEKNSTKIQNPSKIWKRRRNKSTKKLTKNYYNKEGKSISPKDYKERLKNYQEKLAKRKEAEKASKKKNQGGSGEGGQGGGTTDENSFSGYIKGQLINETKSNYGKFRQYLKEILK